jgi:hypothetical protein
MNFSALNDDSESLAGIRERVRRARETQNVKLLGSDICANAQMQSKEKIHFFSKFLRQNFESFKSNCGLRV